MNSSMLLERWLLISTPAFFMASIAKGLTLQGFVPALKTSKRSPYMDRKRPSAICERAEFWVQINNIFFSSRALHSPAQSLLALRPEDLPLLQRPARN